MKPSVDYYKVLGLPPSATKDEVKEAFRRLAVKYHPDKHSLSSRSVRDDATLRFKQVSEAYDVLVDHCKRSEYNIRRSTSDGGRNYYGNSGFGGGGGGGGGGRSSGEGYGYGYGYGKGGGRSESLRGFAYRFEIVLRYMTTRAFLLNATFACALLGAAVVIDRGRDTLWKMQNSGKSFEDAMESIEKAKAQNSRK